MSKNLNEKSYQISKDAPTRNKVRGEYPNNPDVTVYRKPKSGESTRNTRDSVPREKTANLKRDPSKSSVRYNLNIQNADYPRRKPNRHAKKRLKENSINSNLILGYLLAEALGLYETSCEQSSRKTKAKREQDMERAPMANSPKSNKGEGKKSSYNDRQRRLENMRKRQYEKQKNR